ncbi:MAG: DUF3426 domain-containing protein [Gammaproteobacteria bacterium]|nr:DUF3426 domain-containing protein [Gammaproteobacteria bacterium]
MFTDCPSCKRQFRIRAAQLGAADGWVRCGNCGETFYALERLSDTPLKRLPTLRQTDEAAAEPPAVSIEPEPEEAAEPEPAEPEPEEAPEPEPVEPEQYQPVAEEAAPEEATPAEPTPEDIEPEQPAETVLQPDEALTREQETAATETTDTDESREALPDLPPVLAGDTEKKTGSPARLIWGSLVFVLSLIAVAQLAWFNRDGLMRAYPALVPWVEQVCESLQCEPIRFRDVSAIELLNRQVTQHPRYRNALLASATMVNGAEFIQPFPDIVLLIFSTDGQVISRGRFKPEEYLGPGVNSSGGMPPGVPVHFGLELSGTSQEAVSFRFRFH